MPPVRFIVKGLSFWRYQSYRQKAVIDFHKCNLCGACVDVCKLKAIIIEKKKSIKSFRKQRAFGFFAEQKKGKLQTVGFEIARQGTRVSEEIKHRSLRCFIGHNMEHQAKELISRGADTVYLVDKEELAKLSE